MQLVMPMSGQSRRFKKRGYHGHKALIDILGQSVIARLLGQFHASWPSTFIMADNHQTSALPDVLKTLRPRATQLFVAPHDLGPGWALVQALPYLDKDLPVLVSYCDYGMTFDADAFVRFVNHTGCDACVVAYRGFHPHLLAPKAYATLHMHNNKVAKISEKTTIAAMGDSFISCGAYYFKNVSVLKEALEHQQNNNIVYDDELFTSLTVEALLQKDKTSDVAVFEIERFYQWGTPEDVEDYKYFEASFAASLNTHRRNVLKKTSPMAAGVQRLMPMAGLGSRFSRLSPMPKPLLPIDDKPLFLHAINSLPQAERDLFVVTEATKPLVQKALRGHATKSELVGLTSTPPGQAFSVAAAVCRLDDDKSIIISACDHTVAIWPEDWQTLLADSRCDFAVMTIQGFAAVRRTPFSYSYVKPQTPMAPNHFGLGAKIERLYVKRPQTHEPTTEHLVVGTFWCRSKALLESALDHLVAEDDRLGDELSFDGIANTLVAMGKDVRLFVLRGFICFGDPECFEESVYWHEVFGGKRLRYDHRYFPGR